MWLFRRHRHLSPELLSGYLDQRLRPGERERVSRRLASCATCREELAGWRNTLAMLQGLEDIPAPRSFTLAGPPPAPVAAPPPVPLRAPRWVYAGAVSMAGLALAVMVSLEAVGLAPAAYPDTGSELASHAAAPAQAPQPGIAADSAEPAAPTPPESETMRAAEATNEADDPGAARAMPPVPFALDETPAPPEQPAEFGTLSAPSQEPSLAEDAAASETTEEAPTAQSGPVAPMGPSGGGSLPPGPEATPLFWRILQGMAAALLVVLLGALVLKRRSSRRSAAN
jgi:hypothetical protein